LHAELQIVDLVPSQSPFCLRLTLHPHRVKKA